MAGVQADRGDTSHRLVSGEKPEVGLKVWTNEYKQGEITKLGIESGDCGWYCPQWHEVTYPDGSQKIFNCDRLTTRKPF
jgi:hypothetical protein